MSFPYTSYGSSYGSLVRFSSNLHSTGQELSVDSTQESNSLANTAIEVQAREIHELKQMVNEQQKTIDTQQRTIELLNSHKSLFVNYSSTLEQKNAVHKEEMQKMESRIQNVSTIVAKNQTNVLKGKSENETLQTMLKIVSTQLSAANAKKNSEKEEFVAKVQNLSQELATANEQNDAKDLENQELQAKINDLSTKLKAAQEQGKSSPSQNESDVTTILLKKTVEAQEKVNAKNLEIKALKKKVTDLSLELATVNEQNDAKKSEIRKLKTKIHQLEDKSDINSKENKRQKVEEKLTINPQVLMPAQITWANDVLNLDD